VSGGHGLSFSYTLLEGLLARLYGSEVSVSYRYAGAGSGLKTPCVLVNGREVTAGGVAVRDVVRYLDHLQVPRIRHRQDGGDADGPDGQGEG